MNLFFEEYRIQFVLELIIKFFEGFLEVFEVFRTKNQIEFSKNK